LNSNYRTDLKNILQVIGEDGKHSTWKISDVECLGKSAETLHQISDEGKEISGEEFYKIVSDIYQVLDGTFEAFKPNENHHWLLIRSIRGDEFDIETEDKELLETIRVSFQDVRDLVY
jgi:hypothetical protein